MKVEWLAGGGEMANVISDLDWSKTSLGPLEAWPQSLRTTVSLMLSARTGDEEQVRRLSTLVDDLLEIGRIRSGQLELRRQMLDLVTVTRDSIERIASQLTQAGCSLTFEAAPSIVGEWDEVRIEQVITNLLENVITYAPRSPVTVTMAAEGESATLAVRDFGPGVPSELRESIFARFERAQASRSAGGLGLGLFITRQVIDAHGGTIEVEAPPDGGARFVVRLPCKAQLQP